MFDYFSKTFVFGAYGIFLLDRMDVEYKSPMRIKAEYFLQAINDFNRMDLLGCIERGEWCRIEYRNEIAGIDTELLCFPLLDIGEMQPWIRSFYSRIVSIEGIEGERWSLAEDIREMMSAREDTEPRWQKAMNTEKQNPWKIPVEIKKVLGEGRRARDHDHVFNEVFSSYSYILAETLTLIGLQPRMSEEKLEEIIEYAIDYYRTRTESGDQACDIESRAEKSLIREIKKLLVEGVFVRVEEDEKQGNGTQYTPVYRYQSRFDFYRDVIALTIKAFPMESICYYDRYHFPQEKRDDEAKALRTLLAAIHNQTIVEIRYRTKEDVEIRDRFQPIVLEYSKRNHRFQVQVLSDTNNHIYTMNVAQILSVAMTDSTYEDNIQQRVTFHSHTTCSHKKQQITSIYKSPYGEGRDLS